MTQSIGRPSHAAATPAEITSRKSLLVVALCWFAIFAEGYDVGVLGAILPALATDPVWKLTPLELGAMGSYTVIGMLIGGIVVGTLSELYGRKPLFMLPQPVCRLHDRDLTGADTILVCGQSLRRRSRPWRHHSVAAALTWSTRPKAERASIMA